MKKILIASLCVVVSGLAGFSRVSAVTTPMQIFSPAGNEQWPVGSTQNITWSAPGTVSSVNISLSPYLACQYSTPRCLIATVLMPIANNATNTGSFSWHIAATTTTGSYIINISDAGGSGMSATSNPFSLTALSDPGSVHPAGTNIVIGGTVYYIQQIVPSGAMPVALPPPTLRAYASAAAFLSYGFNSWNNVVAASAGDLALAKNSALMPYADGSLVNDNGTVYVISDGQKFGVTSADVFLSLGYNWTNLINGDTSYIPEGPAVASVSAHLPGALVNQSGTIYYITDSGKMGIPSMDVFNSWGFNLANVVAANGADVARPANPYAPLVSAWVMGQLSPAVGPPMLAQ